VADEKCLIIKPDNVIIIDMMPEVLIADVFESSVTRSTNPAEHATQLGVAPIVLKHRVVSTLVYKIGSDDHPVSSAEHAREKGIEVFKYKKPPA
jgi:hypothetical protein